MGEWCASRAINSIELSLRETNNMMTVNQIIFIFVSDIEGEGALEEGNLPRKLPPYKTLSRPQLEDPSASWVSICRPDRHNQVAGHRSMEFPL